MRLIGSYIKGLFYIFGAFALIGSLPKCSPPPPRVDTANIGSVGDCLLPGIHGSARYYKNKDGVEFCVMAVLEGGWSADGTYYGPESCRLNTYNFEGLRSKADFVIGRQMLLPVSQSENVCSTFVPYAEWKVLNTVVQGKIKAPSPLLDTKTTTIKNHGDRVSFGVQTPQLDTSNEAVQALKFQIEREIQDFIRYYRTDSPLVQVSITPPSKSILVKHSVLCQGEGQAGALAWKCDDSQRVFLDNSTKKIMGMEPQIRKQVYDLMEAHILSSAVVKAGASPEYHRDHMLTAIIIASNKMNLRPEKEQKILKEFKITPAQLAYVKSEGEAIGWFDDFISEYESHLIHK
ncbi:hypothetical protein ACYZT8_03245 [Pseudomonas sp. LB3P93]